MPVKMTKPGPVKLFIGMLSGENELFERLKDSLIKCFGAVDLESPVWPWGHTKYYEEEMGVNLKRKFIFFEKLISPADIAGIKIKTTDLEQQYLNPPSPPFNKGGTGGLEGGRRINLDPGYLDSARIALVSTKDFAHRIYLMDGIYGEVTLTYNKGSFQTFPYTYPDFKLKEYQELFKKARKVFQNQLSILKP